MKNTSILKEFFGLSKKSINLGDNTFELGKIYSDPYARAFNPQPTTEGSGIGLPYTEEDEDGVTERKSIKDLDELEKQIEEIRNTPKWYLQK